jgi:hypothetical protein
MRSGRSVDCTAVLKARFRFLVFVPAFPGKLSGDGNGIRAAKSFTTKSTVYTTSQEAYNDIGLIETNDRQRPVLSGEAATPLRRALEWTISGIYRFAGKAKPVRKKNSP